MKLTVLVITAREAHCFVGHPEWNQYDRLAQTLAAQTFRDYETVVVTPWPAEAADTGALAIAPRFTPWRRERTRCAASARNTGLAHARGDYTVCLDDGVELPADYLERVVGWLERGLVVATLTADATGEIVDGRRGFLESYDTAILRDAVALGLVAAPTELLVDLGGWDEHFDGGYGLEDADLGVRLAHCGIGTVLDRHIFAHLHDLMPLSPRAVAPDDDPADPVRSTVRCCNPGFVLAREMGLARANAVPYSQEQINRRLRCFLWHDGMCGYWNNHGACAYPHMAREGHPVARRIMVDEGYPEVFDVARARRENGIT